MTKSMLFTNPRQKFIGKSDLDIALSGLILCFWLMARPFHGIFHDSRLYTLQALNRLYPEIFGRDVFFRGASQDSYTIFPAFHALAIRFWGIDQAAYTLTLLGKLGWFLALVYLARGLLGKSELWLGLTLVICIDPAYDNENIFSYGESFLTARLYAEATGLLALGCWARHKPLWAFAWAMAALSLHPLMALPVLTVLVCTLAPSVCHGFMGLLGVMAGGLAILFLASPEAAFLPLRLYDQDWFEIVAVRNSNVFLSNWELGAWGSVAFSAAIGFITLALGEGRDQRLAGSILVTTGLALLFSWLGACVFHHILFTQLQLWRFLWLFQVLGLLMLARVAPLLWQGTLVDRLCLGLLGCALLLEGRPQLFLIVPSVLAWAYLRWNSPDWRPSRPLGWTLGLFPLLVLIIKLSTLDYQAQTHRLIADTPVWATLLTDPLALLPLVALFVFVARGKDDQSRYLPWGLGLLSTVFGLLYWDQSPAKGQFENPVIRAAIAPVQRFIPPQATVYWQGGLDSTWFILKRAHYASVWQGAGALFSRDSARLLQSRQRRLLRAQLADGEIPRGKIVLPTGAAPTFTDLSYLCEDPELDFAIMNSPLSPRVDLAFGSPNTNLRGYVYSCARLRSDPASYFLQGSL